MHANNHALSGKVALVTGSADRIGAQFIKALHTNGATVMIHYRKSKESANKLLDELNTIRSQSAYMLQADLCHVESCQNLITETASISDRLDILVNNASSFFPTTLGGVSENQWEDLHCSNLKAPFFLSQAAAPWLKKSAGRIVNMADIHGLSPLDEHAVYCSAKAGLIMLTRSLAKELAPEVCVNAIAPGAILWPEGSAAINDNKKQSILDCIPLDRMGDPKDLVNMLLFLVSVDNNYITGQVFPVDGGKSL